MKNVLRGNMTSRYFALCASAAVLLLALSTDAPAADVDAGKAPPSPPPQQLLPGHYKIGDIDLAISGVATVGTSIRTTGNNPLIVWPRNGALLGIPATAVGGSNADDAELNWAKGKPVSSVAKAFLTFDATYKDIGAFVRAKTWYDWTLATQGVPWGNVVGGYLTGNPINQSGWNPLAKSQGIAFQEAYAYVKHKADAVTLEARVGDIVVPWGLPTMVQGGSLRYAVNRPGAQPEEVFIPTPGAFARIAFDKATIEGFGLFKAPRSVQNGCGSFYTLTDWAPTNCNFVVIGQLADPFALGAGSYINRLSTPENHSVNFGFGGTYVIEPNATKVGLYYAHVDAPYPMPDTSTSLRSVPPVPWIPGNPGGTNPHYFTEYAPSVNSFALNFTTKIKGTTLYGEYTFKPNSPLQFSASDILNGLLTNGAPTVLRAEYTGVPAGSVVQGWDRRKMGNLILGARQIVPDVLGAKALVIGGEFALKNVYDLPNQQYRRYLRPDTWGLGPVLGFPNSGCTAATPAFQCSTSGFVSSIAWGYRLLASLQYDHVFKPGVSVTPSIGLSHDVYGWSHDYQLVEGRIALNLKLRAEYAKKYFIEARFDPQLRNAFYDITKDRQVFTVAAGMKF